MRGFGEKNEAPNWKKRAKNDSNSKGESCAKGHAMLAKLKNEGIYPLESKHPRIPNSSSLRSPVSASAWLLAAFPSVDLNFVYKSVLKSAYFQLRLSSRHACCADVVGATRKNMAVFFFLHKNQVKASSVSVGGIWFISASEFSDNGICWSLIGWMGHNTDQRDSRSFYWHFPHDPARP